MKTLLTITALLLLTGAGCVTQGDKNKTTPPESELIYCTQDAMQCPDGNYVGRTGPNCQFVCP